jgi:heme oxygenase
MYPFCLADPVLPFAAKLIYMLARGLRTDGHRFFVFHGIDPFGFKARYRQMLDVLNWPRSQERVFLNEVGEAHRLNVGLLTELKERWT